jgi:hypothetical protein
MLHLTPILTRASESALKCTKETCSVEDSVYGYYPSKLVTFILLALFAISCIWHLAQGFATKSKSFATVFVIGTALEVVGTFSSSVFRISLIYLI